jgi:hypothetical protein
MTKQTKPYVFTSCNLPKPDNYKQLDLWCKVEFADGSVWDENWFKRIEKYNEKKHLWVSTNKFENSFMYGPDEMPATRIKAAFKEWLQECHDRMQTNPVKITWYFA